MICWQKATLPLWLLSIIGCIGLSDAASLCTPFPYFDSHDHAVCPIDATAPIWQSKSLDSVWVKGDACHGSERSQFCTFTHPRFNRGLGIALITTDAILEDISSSFTVQAPDSDGERHAAVAPYEAKVIPGKGVGLIAPRDIRQGELIMARTPAVVVDGKAFKDLGTNDLTQALAQAIMSLPQQHQHEYLQLSTHDDATTYEERVYKVFATNNFRTKFKSGQDFHSTFTEGLAPLFHVRKFLFVCSNLTRSLAVSRLNHECRPNSGYHFDASTLSQKVYAARDIHSGEELSIAYYEYGRMNAPSSTHADCHGQSNSSPRNAAEPIKIPLGIRMHLQALYC